MCSTRPLSSASSVPIPSSWTPVRCSWSSYPAGDQGRFRPSSRNEITRLEGQVATLRANLTNILDLAAEVKDHTIDKILEKDDLALGLDVLLGKHRL